jgi:hypothetical protein
MPRHNNLPDLKHSLTEQLNEQLNEPSESGESNQKRKYTKKDACVPLGICGLFVCFGLLCGYLIHEGYLIEDGSI